MKKLKFLCRIIGLFTLLFCQTALAFEVTETPTNKMREQAQLRYDALFTNLSTIANDPSNFWQIAMALDPMIEFAYANNKNIEELGKIASNIYLDKLGKGEWWWDDFGWWGHIFTKLYQCTKNVLYFDHAGGCFSAMQASKRAWIDCQDSQKDNETPLFEGGCYNSPIEIPHPDAEQCIQNTVTNAQFLRLAIALYKLSYDLYLTDKNNDVIVKHYWLELTQQYNWFLSWFTEGLLNNTFAGEHHVLIEERVSKYANKMPASNYIKDRFWTGDQGVMLAAFTDLASIYDSLEKSNPLKLEHAFLKTSLQQGIDLMKGVQKWLVTSKENSTILPFERTRLDDFPFNYQSDYKAGPAVLFSSLIDGARNNQAPIIQKLQNDGYKIIVDKNYRVAIDQSCDIENIDDFIQVATNLAAINLAIFQNALKPSTPVPAPSIINGIFKGFFGQYW